MCLKIKRINHNYPLFSCCEDRLIRQNSLMGNIYELCFGDCISLLYFLPWFVGEEGEREGFMAVEFLSNRQHPCWHRFEIA
jgi:hypothetical protein